MTGDCGDTVGKTAPLTMRLFFLAGPRDRPGFLLGACRRTACNEVLGVLPE